MDLISPKDLLSVNKNLKYFGGESFAKLLMKILKLDTLNKKYSPVAHLNRTEFVDKAIEIIGFKYKISQEDINKIPKEGPFITISNHPFGGLDGLVLMKTLPSVRPDYKILSTFLMTNLKPLEDIFLAVNPFETHKDVKSSLSGLRDAFHHLRKGHPLGIYPAGEVSTYRFDKKSITDRKWQSSVIKFIKKAKVPVIPIYFDGTNSNLFHLLGFIHPLLRTIKLPSELFNKKGTIVKIRIGNPIPVGEQEKFSDIDEYKRFLRTKVYGLSISLKNTKTTDVKIKYKDNIIEPVPSEKIHEEISQIQDDHLLFKIQNNLVFCVPSYKIPNILIEIGRLREITYREVGEGTNQIKDVDKYDSYYEQLFIWDDEAKKIIGGYRVGKGKEIFDKFGMKGFYIHSLFKINNNFLPILNESIELGRSFIIKEYQKKPISLFLLWKGILYFLLKHPEYRYLIGPVSISNIFSNFSKSLTVEFIKANHYNYELAENIIPRKIFKVKINKVIDNKIFIKDTKNDIGKLDDFIQEIEPDFHAPILIKKYFQLNAEIIGFNIDPKFNDCLDCLMILDLLDVPMNIIESLSKELNDNSILERFNQKNS